ncbi:MAG: hypothetical protein GY754_04845 [bacterium]|nr:hypothetical protein [bacterium]
MKNLSLILLLPLLLFSCSTYTMKTEVEDSSAIEKLKSSGIIMRLPVKSFINTKRNGDNVLLWLEGYKKVNTLSLVQETSDEVGKFKSEFERFYQLSINKTFLKYKSMGVVKLYLRNNKEALENLMNTNNLDSLILYEVDGGFSTALQYLDFNTVITVVDRKLNVLYLDHQINAYDIDEMDEQRIEKYLYDKISNRLLTKLDDIGFIEEK